MNKQNNIKKFDITIITDPIQLGDGQSIETNPNVVEEDAILRRAFEKRGLKTNRIPWSDVNYDWSQSKYAIFRSTWDYFDQMDRFKQWIEETSSRVEFINSKPLIDWNLNKYYLRDLKEVGVNIVDTLFVAKGENTSLTTIIEQVRWDDVIVKPIVSGGAKDTYNIRKDQLSDGSKTFNSLVSVQGMMVQPLQQFVLEEGEYSLIFIQGDFTHAVKKVAKPGDFRVQDDFGGTVQDHKPDPSQIAFGKKVVSACPTLPHYARVDLIKNNEGEWAVMELELIEPELWFRRNKTAADLLADAIISIA